VKLIITSGATREPIDDVRFISNISTGSTGAAIADAFSSNGDRVVYLAGEGAVLPNSVEDCRSFSSAQNLLDQLRLLLGGGDFHAVIQCAAVADYRPVRYTEGKIPSSLQQLHIKLEPTPKILPQIKGMSRSPLAVVGFKLTAGADDAERHRAVASLFEAGTVDAVVHNDLDEYEKGPERLFSLHVRSAGAVEQVPGLAALTTRLREVLLRANC
jgi:phosphopantothenoylcysteine decarboxylase/phosphopantothenate--cysteine ligase